MSNTEAWTPPPPLPNSPHAPDSRGLKHARFRSAAAALQFWKRAISFQHPITGATSRGPVPTPIFFLFLIWSVLQCVAVSYNGLQCVEVWCSVLQCGVACWSLLQCVAAYCSNSTSHNRSYRHQSFFFNLKCVAESYSELQCVAVWYSVVQCGAVWCSVLQYVAVCCSVWTSHNWGDGSWNPFRHPFCCFRNKLQRVAVCCSVLHCIAVHCSVSQCIAVCCSVLQCVAVCCSVLQCVAVIIHNT